MENCASKFADLYKSNTKFDKQEERRQQLLKEQKQKRSIQQDVSRDLQRIVSKNYDTRVKKFKFMERRFNKKYHIDAKLQLSEWLKEKPENLNDWYLVPCPKGQRCMVIACNGYTEAYNKAGRLLASFQSTLPGNDHPKNDVTILDCVFFEGRSLFYVLDALAFGNHDLVNCEAQFRFFWVHAKFQENHYYEELDTFPYEFTCLKFYDFADTSAADILHKFPMWFSNFPQLDGFLLYHKEASYTFGTTPLVGWLCPFMVPEVLGLSVHPEYMKLKPEGYTDHLRYIIEFDEAMAKRTYKYRKAGKMDEEYVPEDKIEEIHIDDDADDSLKALFEAEKNLELEGNDECTN